MYTTLLHDPVTTITHNRTPFVKGGEAEVYVQTTTPWQHGHTHSFEVWDKHGDGLCIGCGAQAWSAWWTADGIYGNGTATWVDEQTRRHADRLGETFEPKVEHATHRAAKPLFADEQHWTVGYDERNTGLAAHQRHLVLMAMNHYDEPARRQGTPVPQMGRHVLVHPEHV